MTRCSSRLRWVAFALLAMCACGRRSPPNEDGTVVAEATLPSWLATIAARGDDPLPSWRSGRSKDAIRRFVDSVSTRNTPAYVAPQDRIAVFDNDGTLWVEQPLYIEAVFTLDRVQALARQHPAWQREPPFKAVLEGDAAALSRLDQHAIAKLVAASHSGMTTEEFGAIVRRWFAGARHPRFGRPYSECAYQPMLELLRYLDQRGFSTYIVSGGGIDFVRTISDRTYGIPADRVVGSSGKLELERRGKQLVLLKTAEPGTVNDGEAKPINIQLHIGKRPILAFGNSDGDMEMLEYTSSGRGPALSLLLHHDDAAREFAYDRTSRIGKLDRALTAARARGWTVVSMKSDWKTILPPK